MKWMGWFAMMVLPLAARTEELADPLLAQEARGSFRQMISLEEIQEATRLAASQIDADLQGEEVVLIAVLKGAIPFASDLLRHIHSPCTLECIRAKSYGMRGSERGALTITGLEGLDLAEKNVLVVEDIFDTGVTLSNIIAHLQALNPKTLRSVVLLTKKVPHLTDYRPDYSLFEIEDEFVIGYGLDYKERWRNLPGVYIAR